MAKPKTHVPKTNTLKTRAHHAVKAWFSNRAYTQTNGKAKASKEACRKPVRED